jgi:hypothetical protein
MPSRAHDHDDNVAAESYKVHDQQKDKQWRRMEWGPGEQADNGQDQTDSCEPLDAARDPGIVVDQAKKQIGQCHEQRVDDAGEWPTGLYIEGTGYPAIRDNECDCAEEKRRVDVGEPWPSYSSDKDDDEDKDKESVGQILNERVGSHTMFPTMRTIIRPDVQLEKRL